MKNLQLLLLLTLTMSAFGYKKDFLTIKGKVKSNEKGVVLYTTSINNAYNAWFLDSVATDAQGRFIISIDIKQPGFILIKDLSCYKKIIVKPGETYNVEIDNALNKIHVLNTSDAQRYYDNLSKSHPHNCFFFENGIADYRNIYDSLNHQLNKELIELNEIKCTDDVRQLLIADRRVYYNLAISSLATRINVNALLNSENPPVEVMKMWGKAVADSFLINNTTQKATYYYDLLGLALWYNIYTKLNWESLSSIRNQKRERGLIHSHNIELAESLLPKEVLEFYSASYILASAYQKKYEQELIDLFSHFKTQYPESKYTNYISQYIDLIEGFYSKISNGQVVEYQFADNYENINSLQEALLPLRGKKVYVDIWATTCGPCKKEFEHNKKLKETLKSKGVEILYISLDSDKQKDLWANMINYYNLSGTHIRANEKLYANLKSLLGFDGIPWYAIFDEQGIIVKNDAPRPSNLTELEKLL